MGWYYLVQRIKFQNIYSQCGCKMLIVYDQSAPCILGHPSFTLLLHLLHRRWDKGPFSAHLWLQPGSWSMSLSRLNRLTWLFHNWIELLSWIQTSSMVCPSILRQLADNATVYHIWNRSPHLLRSAGQDHFQETYEAFRLSYVSVDHLIICVY